MIPRCKLFGLTEEKKFLAVNYDALYILCGWEGGVTWSPRHPCFRGSGLPCWTMVVIEFGEEWAAKSIKNHLDLVKRHENRGFWSWL